MGGFFIHPDMNNDGEYEGEMKEGKRHGKGKLLFPDGKIFEGEFRNGGMKNGTYRNKDNSLIARGEFSGYLQSGWGKYRLDKDTINGYGPGFREYEGGFFGSHHHGKGVLRESRGPGWPLIVTETEFRSGIACGSGVSSTNYPDGEVWTEQGEFGVFDELSERWGLLEGNLTITQDTEKYVYKNLKLNTGTNGDYYFSGHLEWDAGKFIGHFTQFGYKKYGNGVLLEDGVLTQGLWADGELTNVTRSASVLIEDYTERADEIIQLKKKKPVQYTIELKRILEDIEFVLGYSKIPWPPHLPGNVIQVYEESISEEFHLIKKRILELDSITPSKKIRNRTIPKSVKRGVWRRDDGKCTQCGSNEDIEYDHIIPHAKGGSNTERNIQLLCESCNRKKSDKIG
jgi:hypothetical protein